MDDRNMVLLKMIGRTYAARYIESSLQRTIAMVEASLIHLSKSICGDANGPADKITSLRAFISRDDDALEVDCNCTPVTRGLPCSSDSVPTLVATVPVHTWRCDLRFCAKWAGKNAS